MELTTMLMATKALSSVLKGGKQTKGVKKAQESQKMLVEETYKYNMKQVNESYINGYSDLMTKYALERYNLSNEVKTVASDINIQTAQQGANLADSSISNDLNNQLDTEFQINLQNLLGSQINDSSMLIANMVSQKLNLDQSRTQSLTQINNVANQAFSQIDGNIKQNLANFGFQLAGDYSDFKSRNPKDTALNFLTKFSF